MYKRTKKWVLWNEWNAKCDHTHKHSPCRACVSLNEKADELFLTLVKTWRAQKSHHRKWEHSDTSYEQVYSKLVEAARRVKKKLSVCCHGDSVSKKNKKPTNLQGLFMKTGRGGGTVDQCKESKRSTSQRQHYCTSSKVGSLIQPIESQYALFLWNCGAHTLHLIRHCRWLHAE